MNTKLHSEKPEDRDICKWKDNTKTDPEEVGCETVDWIHLAQDRVQWRALVNTIMKLWIV
jgi:hypothetical protein